MQQRDCVRGAIVGVVCAICLSGNALADPPRNVNVPAGELIPSIEVLAKQLNVDVIYASKPLRQLKTAGVSGELEPLAAFETLLQGTGLAVKEKGRSILISKKPVALAPANPAPAPTPVPTASTAPQPEVLEELNSKGLPEIVVRGSRTSLNADIERTNDDVQPYVVFTGEELRASMATNLEDFLKNRLPMNTASATDAQDARRGSNISTFNLRGLGIDETLILVNGRRRPGVSNITRTELGSGFGQPDINGIALTAIERIEVLPATAAGIYGGGATGGVINIILKTDFQGLDVTARYANTFDTDSAIKFLSANGGMSLEGGRSSISISASISEQNLFLVRDRSFLQRARALQLRNDPESFTEAADNMPVGYTTNIASNEVECLDPGMPCTRRNLVLKEGLVDLGSAITHIPVGYKGNLQDLIDNAGRYNLDLANDINEAGRSLQNNPRDNSIDVTFHRTFTDKLSMFANVGRTENNGSVLSAGLTNSAFIAASAPNNPFTSDIQVTFPVPGLAYKQQVRSESLNGLIGASYLLPHRWSVQLEGSWGRSRVREIGGTPLLDNDIRNPPETGDVVRPGIQSDIQNGTLDVLRDLNSAPLDLSAYTLSFPNDVQSPSSISKGYVLRASGPVKRLPAGDLVLSGLIERRENEAEATVVRGFVGPEGSDQYFYYPSRSTTADSYYLEANVPIVSSRNEPAWLKSLELQASTRRDVTATHTVTNDTIRIADPKQRPENVVYTDSSEAATGYTFGFRAEPISDVAVRASFSHGFLPASIAQLAQVSTVSNTESGYSDPVRLYERLGARAPVTIVEEGNPNLKPELSDSISTGLIFRPRFLEDLRLSVDYTQIKKTNEIVGIDYELLFLRPDLYPGRLVRGPALGDGLPGPVTYLDVSLVNIDRTEIEALDFQLGYSLWSDRYGSFYLHGIASRQLSSSRRVSPQSAMQNHVGFLDGPLRWRGTLGLDWMYGALSVGWNMQYFDSYLIYERDAPPSDVDLLTRIQGSRKIPRQQYHDVAFKYNLDNGLAARFPILTGVVISGGIQNVFNTLPPIDANSGGAGYSTYGDPRLRRYTIEITKSFAVDD